MIGQAIQALKTNTAYMSYLMPINEGKITERGLKDVIQVKKESCRISVSKNQSLEMGVKHTICDKTRCMNLQIFCR